MKIAYFDCLAGAAGDMIVAAMIDAGVDAEDLKAQLEKLRIDGLGFELSQTTRAGLRALSFKPFSPEHQHHRNLEQIIGIIRESKITDAAKELAITAFNKLADAEAAVHGKQAQDITFHEVGAIDSIADIVCAAIAIQSLHAMGLKRIYCSQLSLGGGSVKAAHGLLPVPAPATAELLKGIPIVGGPVDAELLTPTAAAILTGIVDHFGTLPSMKIETVGYGAGSRDFARFSNVVRLILGETADEPDANADTVCLLETNVDDISGELVGTAVEKLLACGSLDVFTTPIYMKQNRPAVKISIICKTTDVAKIQRNLFEQGLTFGIRTQIMQRTKLVRQFVTVSTQFGEIRIKVGSLDGRIVNVKPELSDCIKAAKDHGAHVKAVIDTAITEYRKTNGS